MRSSQDLLERLDLGADLPAKQLERAAGQTVVVGERVERLQTTTSLIHHPLDRTPLLGLLDIIEVREQSRDGVRPLVTNV